MASNGGGTRDTYQRNGRRWPSCGTLVTVAKSHQSDYIDWDAGREGYVSSRDKYVPVVAIQKPPKARGSGHLLGIRAEERLGCLLAAAGTIWAVYVATVDYDSLWRMRIMPPGPVEVCALGILAWLHAKWRRSTKVN
jgi:hypothetical protein